MFWLFFVVILLVLWVAYLMSAGPVNAKIPGNPNADEPDALADHDAGDPSQDPESDTEPYGY
jgi:hypothetical protein